MNTLHPIAPIVHRFFHQYLSAQRGLSVNTIACYRDSLKLLFQFAAARHKQPVDKLTMEHFNSDVVLAFLDDLEVARGNSPRTRNNRLAALRAFFRHAAREEPLLLAQCQRLCQIPLKNTPHHCIDYLEDKEVRTLLSSVDSGANNALRDYALLLFLYNTGARVQEVVDLQVSDVRRQAPLQVRLFGKGNKERVCPLWSDTVLAIDKYLQARYQAGYRAAALFLNARGHPITRFGIRHIVRQYATKAAQACPSLATKHVSPHLIRHSTAMALLQSGNAITVVKDWLGHADVNTTHGYVEIDLQMKRQALEACQAPEAKTAKQRRPKWQDPGLLEWLDELTKPSRNYVECKDGMGCVRA
jgi:site-specific recombinase XerD